MIRPRVFGQEMEGFMKKGLGLIGASLLLFAGPALAADLPVKAPVYKAPPVVIPTWAGWYVGANAGWVGSGNDTVTNNGTDTGTGGLGTGLANGALPTSVNLTSSGFLGGCTVRLQLASGRLGLRS
jgi:outer membrane immunogenic protein